MRRVSIILAAAALAAARPSAAAQTNFTTYVSVGDSLAAGVRVQLPRGDAPEPLRPRPHRAPGRRAGLPAAADLGAGDPARAARWSASFPRP